MPWLSAKFRWKNTSNSKILPPAPKPRSVHGTKGMEFVSMISSLKIEGYRGFDQFEMNGLGRINLLVGTNNSGKSSVLEAISLLVSPASLTQILRRRDEGIGEARPQAREHRTYASLGRNVNVTHIFRGHDPQIGSFIQISTSQTEARFVRFSIREWEQSEKDELSRLYWQDLPEPEGTSVFEITGNPDPGIVGFIMTQSGAVPSFPPALPRGKKGLPIQVCLISTESLSREDLVGMWNNIALTPHENLVLNALRFLDDKIEGIAAQANTFGSSNQRGGFILKLKGQDLPVPIGSMGDGMWRILALAIAITQCKGGVLLVDEIDTGLHYTVMSQMWKLIYNTAKELDVQVFATTHSYDCIHSLAQICSSHDMEQSVTVQRIEPGKKRAVPYDEEEITIAALKDIEVR